MGLQLHQQTLQVTPRTPPAAATTTTKNEKDANYVSCIENPTPLLSCIRLFLFHRLSRPSAFSLALSDNAALKDGPGLVRSTSYALAIAASAYPVLCTPYCHNRTLVDGGVRDLQSTEYPFASCQLPLGIIGPFSQDAAVAWGHINNLKKGEESLIIAQSPIAIALMPPH